MAASVHIPGDQGGAAAPLVDAPARGLTITFTVNRDGLSAFSDAHLAQLWHIAQANPAPFGDRNACDFAEAVGREIITRWLAGVPPELWHHQGRHVQRVEVLTSEVEA